MPTRVFLGWDRPFLPQVVTWLLNRRDDLPHLLVVVPTSHSGRRLRAALAEQAGALLTPTILTPGGLLQTPSPAVATEWMERVAWVETLEEVSDWSIYHELFPEPPSGDPQWAGGLAREMTQLRRSLQENGLTLSSAAQCLADTVEAGRWDALSRLETLMERRIQGWGRLSRSRVLANGLALPENISGIVLAGVTEMPPLLERAWLAWSGPVTILLGAPPHEAQGFSSIGRPLECWTQRALPWPDGSAGSVQLVADAQQQASEAVRAVATAGTASNEVALGAASTATGDELVRAFTRHGWVAFHPAALPVTTGLARWLLTWLGFLADPKLAIMADLLAMPESSGLIGNRRVHLSNALSRLRNEWMMARPEDLRHRITTATFPTESHRQNAAAVLHAAETFAQWRTDFLREDFATTIARLLNALGSTAPTAADEAAALLGWLTQAAPLIRQVTRTASFWIDLLLANRPAPTADPPAGRVLDVQGWLELLYEPCLHLVVCDLNEGMVPARFPADPWLGDAARNRLGLTSNAARAARDAFLYQAMIEARRDGGRVDLFCAKSAAGGESLLPSRLLLAATPSTLPERVQFLFREVEPPEAGLRWHADWQWHARRVAAPARIHVTSLTTYLACPFRYYLKHAVGMQRPEADRSEWNARDFGIIAHDVMEHWGRDLAARQLTAAEPLARWLSAELDRLVAESFGPRVPLAVRVQADVLRQRLAWLARTQAATRADGWDVIAVEHKIEIPIGHSIVVCKIDRIDRHRDHGGLRIIDYKTGRITGVENAHRSKMTARTLLPAHLTAECPAVHVSYHHEKPANFLWRNLQLPLYALAVSQRDGCVPTPCYFSLGATAADVAIHEWPDFTSDDLDAASTCATWLVAQITAGVFWPPAAKVRNEDFTAITAGRSLIEMVAPFPSIQSCLADI